MRRACAEMAQFPDVVRMSVNVSPSQFETGDLPERIAEILEITGFPAKRLILEITENTKLCVSPKIQNQIQRLHAMGTRLLLDDFGAGFASLAYLNQFDVDGIKLDGSFIQNLLTASQSKAEAIIRSIVQLTQNLNLTLTVEKVETPEQSAWLVENGATWQQGFYHAHPVALDTLHDAIAKGCVQFAGSHMLPA